MILKYLLFFSFPVIHWLIMTAWVIWQDTDFCNNMWEERLYNAIVGFIYCFCFFNLKEGQSRYRAVAFYVVIIFENLAFLAAFYFFKPPEMKQQEASDTFTYYLITSAFAIVVTSMVVGLISMLVYYRFFHPAGPIKIGGLKKSVNFENDLEELKRNNRKSPKARANLQNDANNQDSRSPDFVVYSTEEAYSSPIR